MDDIGGHSPPHSLIPDCDRRGYTKQNCSLLGGKGAKTAAELPFQHPQRHSFLVQPKHLRRGRDVASRACIKECISVYACMQTRDFVSRPFCQKAEVGDNVTLMLRRGMCLLSFCMHCTNAFHYSTYGAQYILETDCKRFGLKRMWAESSASEVRWRSTASSTCTVSC